MIRDSTLTVSNAVTVKLTLTVKEDLLGSVLPALLEKLSDLDLGRIYRIVNHGVSLVLKTFVVNHKLSLFRIALPEI